MLAAASNILLVLAIIALLADWRQTLRIFAPDSRWREINPAINALVRRLGAPTGVHLWFGSVALAVGVVAALLPSEARLCLAVVAAATELYWVVHNWRLGIRIY